MGRTLNDVLNIIRENDIEIVDFKMTDIQGRWRHLSIPAERLTEDTMKYGIGFDGSNYGYAAVENSDMVFVPDLDSAVIDTFCAIPTLSMIGDVMVIGKENTPFDQYPRNVAKRANEYMKKTGIADEMIIGPEYEFYIFDGVEYDNAPNHAGYRISANQSEWETGSEANNYGFQIAHANGYHTTLPMDVNNDIRSEACLTMKDWGVRVKYHHHEVGGCGQMEIEVELDEMTKMADNTMSAKYVIKNTAVANGKTATFMPKPVVGEAGSGLHVHMLLLKDGKPLFYDENGYSSLSETALHFIGGLLIHARSLCAITNPSTNSYKRLIPGFEAPVTLAYATANRSAVIRIPAYAKSPMQKRFELRNPDATCNPYYAFAAILMAGLDGIEKKIDPHALGYGPYDGNLYELPEEVRKSLKAMPASLGEAMDELEKDHDYLTKGGVFPERLIEILLKNGRAADEHVARIPHPEEFKMYYDL